MPWSTPPTPGPEHRRDAGPAALARRAVLAVAVGAAGLLVGAPGASAQVITYVPPVDAPVVEGYSAPLNPYGPGNRGIDYDTTPGQAVTAAAAGTVTFAGPVAAARHVTVAHADGIRTTYAFVATVVVRAGQRVTGGEIVATAGEQLHFSVRLGEAYLDPAVLLGAGGPPRVRLVPDAPDGAPPGSDPVPRWRVAGAPVVAPAARAWLDRSLAVPTGRWRAAGTMLAR